MQDGFWHFLEAEMNRGLSPAARASRLSAFAVGALMSLAPAALHADVSYLVSVNTSSVSGNSGFLDFQFNPGNSTTQQATAVISNFTGGATQAVPTTTGSVN